MLECSSQSQLIYRSIRRSAVATNMAPALRRRRRELWVLVLVCCVLCASGFTASLRQRAKTNLIQTISRGGSENDVLAAVRQTELLNPTRWPGALASPLLSDNWLMVWTTSESIAGKRRPAFLQTRTPPEQLLDVRNGRALNAETVLGFTNAVEIALTQKTRSKAAVQFERFRLGPISFPAPAGLSGELDTTFLDETMRVSRGDQGNVFVLLRESTERREADAAWDGWRRSW